MERPVKVLVVHGTWFTGGAVFEKGPAGWVCTDAPPAFRKHVVGRSGAEVLRWLKSSDQVKSWSWI